MRKAIILACLIFLAFPVFSQSRFSTFAYAGVATPLLDSGLGFGAGINPAYRFGKYFQAEGQVSYTGIHVNSTFLSGRSGSESALMALLGPRLTLWPERKTNFFANALIGLGYVKEMVADGKYSYGTEAAVSFGVGLTHKGSFRLGLSMESPTGYLILKGGVVF